MLMITALENLNTTIAGRPSVPPEDHTTYNHDPDFYDLSTFPEDVKRRNKNANNPYYVYKDSELVPYKFNTEEARSAGFGRLVDDETEIERRYFSKFRDIFTIDGSHFHLEYRGSDKMKQFNNNFPVLPKNPDPYQRRLWYIQIVVHCRTHGIYLPPWCTLRPGVHTRGFECDDGENGDIPSMFDKYLHRWSTHIAEGIMYKNSDIVILNKAGYNWIYNFVQRDHPKFMSKPQNLTLDRPKQRKDETVADFQFRYHDWCMVRGIVENHAPSLDSTVEMDSFISCCNHGTHIHSCIAIDRQNPENASKYTVEQIANTIDTVLREHPPSTKMISSRTRFTGNPYRRTTVNQLEEKSDSESDPEDIDDSPSNRITPTILEAVLAEVKANPKSADNPTCIVCRIINPDDADHPFSRCKLLQNHEHCQDMYKEGMKFIRRSLNHQRRVLKLPEETETATINAMIANINENGTQDFQEGNDEK